MDFRFPFTSILFFRFRACFLPLPISPGRHAAPALQTESQTGSAPPSSPVRATFERALASVQDAFGRTAIPVQIPIGSERDFKGVVK
jgi:hypothetical protein